MMHDKNLLRQDEAWEFLRSLKDPVMSQLMNRAVFYITKGFSSGQPALRADLDFRFLVEVLAEFFEDQESLKRILNGEDLRLWSDDEDD